jgi:hypothetical protein
MEQRELYEPVRKWLESQGFQVLVTGGDEQQMVIPIGDILPVRVHMVPDLVGVKESDSRAAIVEVETDLRKIVEVIGKCMIWKTFATLVYAAYPLEKCKRFKVFEKLGLGLLGVSQDKVTEVVEIMPNESTGLFRVLELHPLDFSKQMELIRLVRGILEAGEKLQPER